MEKKKIKKNLINIIFFSFFIYLILKDLQYFVYDYRPIFFYRPIYIYFLDYFYIFLFTFFFIKKINLINYEIFYSKIIKIFFLYNFFIIIFGIFKANSYWDYKTIFIEYIPFLFFITSIFFGFLEDKRLIFFKFFFNFIFPLSVFIFFIYSRSIDGFTSRMVVPISLFIIFLPYLKNVYKINLIILSIIIIFFDQSIRTYLLQLILSILLSLFLYLKIKKNYIYNKLFYFVVMGPLFFIFLAIFYNFDLFDYLSNFLFNQSNFSDEISANTRSFLYEEMYENIKSIWQLIFGNGASASYESYFFSSNLLIFSEGRYGTEVGFLNIILKSGLLGFIIVSLLFLYPAYIGINYSNNVISKIISIKLTFYWLFLFVEYYQMVNLSYFVIYFLIGILLSKSFRNLNDHEIKNYFINNGL